ncbi:MAG: hypothetical protein HND56_05210 [Pseudomonadota bacterium]|nr:hypothetical protein [Pseudomonadota bacterium]QKK05122.1 MAG: hypothetical protein HND56_05210 [Pseudomonadota bacterium]
MTARVKELENHLKAGRVYRRADLAHWSNAVDRHVQLLQKKGVLKKLSGGLYYVPKKTPFGDAPADEEKLVEAFLRDHRFLVTSPNAYNALGLGTTQLYNETVIYNHKRHGHFKLGGRMFDFRMRPRFPAKLTQEFLLVDLVNNLDRLAEDPDALLRRVTEKVREMDQKALFYAVREYGTMKTRKFFETL